MILNAELGQHLSELPDAQSRGASPDSERYMSVGERKARCDELRGLLTLTGATRRKDVAVQ